MKLNESLETRFYVSDAGYLVIEQESYEFGKTVQILISPEQTKLFFNHLPKLIQQQAHCWTGIYSQEDEDV